MAARGLNATGKTSESIEYVKTEKGFQIVANKSMEALEFGRKPTTRSEGGKLVEALKEWAKARGIPEAAVYPIAKKIHKEGIKVPNAYNKGKVISDVINEKLEDEIRKEATALFTTLLTNKFK